MILIMIAAPFDQLPAAAVARFTCDAGDILFRADAHADHLIAIDAGQLVLVRLSP